MKAFAALILTTALNTLLVSQTPKSDTPAKKDEKVGPAYAIIIGHPVPDFKLIDETGTERLLSDWRGKKVALFFYPKDYSPWCTEQVCNLRDGYQTLWALNMVVVGISRDASASHRKFRERYALPFTLLSDPQQKVAKLYDVNGWLFTQRATFLIDETGILLDIIKDVDTEFHVEQIVRHMRELEIQRRPKKKKD